MLTMIRIILICHKTVYSSGANRVRNSSGQPANSGLLGKWPLRNVCTSCGMYSSGESHEGKLSHVVVYVTAEFSVAVFPTALTCLGRGVCCVFVQFAYAFISCDVTVVANFCNMVNPRQFDAHALTTLQAALLFIANLRQTGHFETVVTSGDHLPEKSGNVGNLTSSSSVREKSCWGNLLLTSCLGTPA